MCLNFLGLIHLDSHVTHTENLFETSYTLVSLYRPKNLDTWKNYSNCPKIGTGWFYQREMHSKDADEMANSVDPSGAVSSVSTLFTQTCTAKNLRVIISKHQKIAIMAENDMSQIFLKL